MTDEIEEHILKRYQVVKKSGSGAYGHVWKVKDKKTDEVFALKKIFDAFQHATDAQRTYRQIMFLKQFDHENIVKLQQAFRAQNDKDMYLVFEFMEADLHNVINENLLQEIHKQYIVYQIALALRYLHSGEVIHRDLKPANILLNSDCFVKLCDFGLVRSVAKFDDHCPVLTEYVATRWYRAPEILLGSNDYTKGVDMWSLGCMIAEVILGKPIFEGKSTLIQLQKILSFTGKPSLEDIDSLKSDLAKSMIQQVQVVQVKTPKQWFPYSSEEVIDLIVNLLQFNPNHRLTADQVLRHPYVKQFAGKGSEILANKVFRIKNDDQKLTTKDYKALIYENIKQERHSQLKHNINTIPKKQTLKIITAPPSQPPPQQHPSSSNSATYKSQKDPRLPTSPPSSTPNKTFQKPTVNNSTTNYQFYKPYTPTTQYTPSNSTHTSIQENTSEALAAYRERKEKLDELLKGNEKKISVTTAVKKTGNNVSGNNISNGGGYARFEELPKETKPMGIGGFKQHQPQNIITTSGSNLSAHFLSPKARLQKVNPPISVKPNSPTIKYVYGTNQQIRIEQPPQPPPQQQQQQQQPFFQNTRKK